MKTGRVVLHQFESGLLVNNPAGDPHVRVVPVYLPPSYAADPERRFPVVYVLTGFTGRGRMLLNDDPWSPSIDERMDRLISSGGCGEMILVMPDCFTRFGGSQYLNSTATGRYMDHIVEELVPFVDREYRTLAGREHRGVMGKSSGGYGAWVAAMMRPGTFGAMASHSGDCYFEYCYRPDIPKFLSAVQAAGGIDRWFAAFQQKIQKKYDDLTVLNIVGMAAAYSPNPETSPFGIDFPCDLETGAFRDDVWNRWQKLDPFQMLDEPRYADALRQMKLVFLDCGTRDEWHLHLGARMMSRKLKGLGIPHEHEEFEDGHMKVQYRYDVTLPKLAKALG
ncbi:MAG: alpha/beta hydrolase-fold protein [Candidatus Eisenbacteria bacterium]